MIKVNYYHLITVWSIWSVFLERPHRESAKEMGIFYDSSTNLTFATANEKCAYISYTHKYNYSKKLLL